MYKKIGIAVYVLFFCGMFIFFCIGEKIGIRECIVLSLLSLCLGLCIWAPMDFLRKKISRKLIDICLAFFTPFVFLLVVYQKPLTVSEFWLFTFIFIQWVQCLVIGVIGNIGWGVVINAGLFCMLLMANCLTEVFRGSPFRPSDILSLGTAWTVRKGYLKTFKLTIEMVIILLFFACVFICVKRLTQKRKQNLVQGLIVRTIALVCSGMFYLFLATFDLEQYEYNGFRVDFHVDDYGYIGQFLLEWNGMKVVSPEEYSKENAEKILSVEDSQIDNQNKNYPDIFVLMDEAFCDYSLIGALPLEKDYLPFFHSVSEDMKGKCYVSVLGGNTCNTEWEFLTGNSLAFYPNSIPFNQYIQDDKFSISRYFKQLGYRTIAVHPWYATGWKRDVVYPMLGFDDFYSINEFDTRYVNMSFDERRNDVTEDEGIYLRDLISDQASFEKVISLYEEHCQKSESPLFVFNVTMQNHGDYIYENYSSPIKLTEDMEGQNRIEQYLGIASETDKALERLISYFENVDRDVIILFFGDHQPRMNEAFYDFLMKDNKGQSVLEEKESRYVVPYMLWSNKEQNENRYKELSANYLSLMLIDYAGLPTNTWYNFLRDTYTEFPVINVFGIKNDEGKWLSFDKKQLGKYEQLKQYERLQYFRMFDEKQ